MARILVMMNCKMEQCSARTTRSTRCKFNAKTKTICFNTPICVCSRHANTNPLYDWSLSYNSNETPSDIKKYLDFYNTCTEYGVSSWGSVSMASELFKTMKSTDDFSSLLEKYFGKIFQEPLEGDPDCPICMEYSTIRIGCGHAFCVECITKWFFDGDAKCPVCRQILSSGIIKQ